MLGGIVILIITSFLAHLLVNRLKGIYPFIDAVLLKRVYYYHVLLSFVYYLYSLFNASDSRYYYRKVVEDFRGPEWMDFYGTSTTFIEFIAYPFIRYLGFSYEAMMVLFTFFGYIGFVYFYIFFKERIKFRHQFLGVDLLTLFFFLPNPHFWSSSLGKGAIILPAIALFFYGISKINKRYIAVALGAVIIYHVRPHIMLVILVSCFIGLVFSTKGISWVFRLVFIAGASVAFFYIYQDVLTMVGINEEEVLTQGFDLSRRARELSKATSGIDISNYGLGLQLFTFIYRPLFFDAPGLLGIVVSIENVFYLLITLKLLNFQGIRYLVTSSFLVKSAFFSFLTVSIALAQISGNLGIAIRQKSQVMMLLLFVIIAFLDERRSVQYAKQMTERLRRKREAEVLMKQKESVRE
jgi:hypothetical protein